MLWQMNIFFRKKYMIILLLSNAVLATENNKNRLNDNVVSHADIDVRNEYNEEGNRVGKRFFSTNHHSVASQKKISPEKICLPITGVFLQGNTLLSSQDLNQIDHILGECISEDDINILAKEVTRLYLSKGYLAARVNFIPLNNAGELGLNVTEGIVEKIEGGGRRVNPYFIFPNFIDKPLRLSELDQAIDQANRLRSNKVNVDILPGSQAGKSIIRINNVNNKPWSLSTVIDNYGYKNSDEWQARVSLALDSPFGLSDSINFNANRTLENAKNRYKNDFTVSYSVPYGALTFSALANYLEYRRYEKLKNGTVNFNGNSQQYNFRTDYMFHRTQKQINSLSMQVEHKQINNYVDEAKVGVYSYRFTNLELGVNQFRILPHGSVNVNAAIKRGVPWFGTHQKNKINAVQFTTGKLMVNFNHNFSLLNSPYQFDHALVGQYSKNYAPSPEWISLTERNAIRGFSRSSQSADHGWYMKNTLSKHFFMGNILFTPRMGVDGGRALKHGSQQGWQSNAGVSAGISMRYHQALFDVEASRGWWLSDSNKQNEPVQVLGRIAYTF
ncbi:ShlB/FhaC/HecB family hemolysin secretion/activation protein [Yersinia pestis subsp. microtus bv. Altaica]|uniref:Hemolysin activator protein n=135 Tax=Yersinia pestis TaxID=632 RepID=A0A384LCW5_YERPE|nr:ShlB/FhaC/HecB family hemolysin secretion/activation protein [Yersinia pestis]EDM42514.1 putative hemolysin activator protein [Yersinia pestis CA88-4125]OSZ90740.1 hemolysin activation protein [Yersinia pestis subsp. microtus bv. Caucasica]OUY12569.1 ShlB/FhaC/HecB family hemolysin secretion/activation protein [Yersinia pestis subsp. microtus bv. Altaica]OVY76662.1 ShlB/FhaC/HecB family hemolysin secretion/activation protein [Yersinia pestis subsp. microtus bv. Xilingolensis]OVY85470.1 ShlB